MVCSDPFHHQMMDKDPCSYVIHPNPIIRFSCSDSSHSKNFLLHADHFLGCNREVHMAESAPSLKPMDYTCLFCVLIAWLRMAGTSVLWVPMIFIFWVFGTKSRSQLTEIKSTSSHQGLKLASTDLVRDSFISFTLWTSVGIYFSILQMKKELKLRRHNMPEFT